MEKVSGAAAIGAAVGVCEIGEDGGENSRLSRGEALEKKAVDCSALVTSGVEVTFDGGGGLGRKRGDAWRSVRCWSMRSRRRSTRAGDTIETLLGTEALSRLAEGRVGVAARDESDDWAAKARAGVEESVTPRADISRTSVLTR